MHVTCLIGPGTYVCFVIIVFLPLCLTLFIKKTSSLSLLYQYTEVALTFSQSEILIFCLGLSSVL